MKFFEKQKIDEIGTVGVRLQKIIIFLAVITATGYLHCGLASAISTTLALVLFYIGFYGSYKRRENCLRFYFVVNVMLIVFACVLVIASLFYVSGEQDDGLRNSSKGELMDLKKGNGDLLPVDPPKTPGIPSDAPSNSSSTPSSPPPMDLSPPSYTGVSLILTILLFTAILVIVALKIQSLVLAAKMAKMLRATRIQNLAHPVVRKPSPQPSPVPFPYPHHHHHHQGINNPEASYQPVVYIPISLPPQQQQQPFVFNPFMMQQSPYMALQQQQQQQV